VHAAEDANTRIEPLAAMLEVLAVMHGQYRGCVNAGASIAASDAKREAALIAVLEAYRRLLP
jgi:hypothetical protein